jgi:hypothetical protein
MKRQDIKDGAKVHYTSIIGRGPSVPVIVCGMPYQMGSHREWSVWVKRLDGQGNPRGMSVCVEALYKRPIAEGVDLRKGSRWSRAVPHPADAERTAGDLSASQAAEVSAVVGEELTKPMAQAAWEPDETKAHTSREHTLDIGPLQLRARDRCLCGCGSPPHWDIEAQYEGECDSLAEAQGEAEQEARNIYSALRERYGDPALNTACADAAVKARAACVASVMKLAAEWKEVRDTLNPSSSSIAYRAATACVTVLETLGKDMGLAHGMIGTAGLKSIAEARGLRVVSAYVIDAQQRDERKAVATAEREAIVAIINKQLAVITASSDEPHVGGAERHVLGLQAAALRAALEEIQRRHDEADKEQFFDNVARCM